MTNRLLTAVFFLSAAILVSHCGPYDSKKNTEPAVSTLAASSVTTTSATLNGTVIPNGKDTGAWFLWSVNPDLSSPVYDTPHTFIGSGRETIPYQYTITGLNPNTIYYYRIEAYNLLGTTVGAIVSFTTSAAQ
jgi:phosphodiesterase/alkaline phosphatase D-like protein